MKGTEDLIITRRWLDLDLDRDHNQDISDRSRPRSVHLPTASSLPLVLHDWVNLEIHV